MLTKARKFNVPAQTPEPGSRIARTAQLQAKRAAKAKIDLARWEKRLRRAKREVARLRRRVVYYGGIVTEYAGQTITEQTPPST